MRSTAAARKFKVLFLRIHGWISQPLCQVKEANGKGPVTRPGGCRRIACVMFLSGEGSNENVLQLVVAMVTQFWETTTCH